ncbi:MAG: gamma-glutamylcysteine synthetase [Candidatus Ancillula sp.]|jgi:glutamate--cysteine ligase|nr:gamma-glutamylcysteine synthetase [Candidatus Ancillula sp.]
MKKLVDSLVEFFVDGAKEPSKFALGLEIEHLVVDKTTGKAFGYWDEKTERGIKQVLEKLEKYFTSSSRNQHGDLLGLSRANIALTLEPGAQFETSIGPFQSVDEFRREYMQFISEAGPICDEVGAQLLTLGYQPKTLERDVTIIPKDRYSIMDDYLAKTGKYGHNMMRCSASTQVSIDYSDEQDAIKKLRISSALMPIYAYYYSNSPYFEGAENTNKMIRTKLWDDLDPSRCSLIPHLYDTDFGFEQYAITALTTRLMVADLTGTPEAYDDKEKVREAFSESAVDIYPDRALNEHEILHILSTYFFDVRLKNYIELRSVDSLPLDTALDFLANIKHNFYNEEKLQELSTALEGIVEKDVAEAKQVLLSATIENQGEVHVYGKPLNYWFKKLGLNEL